MQWQGRQTLTAMPPARHGGPMTATFNRFFGICREIICA